jgi:predicted DNA-binding protein
MFDAIKPLLDAGIINEDTRTAISEAWEQKLNEAREEVRAELREEFSQRYEHDKGVMIDALDNMVTEALSAEISEFAEEKKSLAEDRVRFKQNMMENANKFDTFMISKLAEEMKELRDDRKNYKEGIDRLEKFVIKALAEEIQEFEADKKAVVETRVRLVAEAKDQMAKLKSQFVERSAQLVKESVSANLETEITQLKEDIQIARENMFGRRLFEAYASEFAVTHLNENREIRKLQAAISDKDKQLSEAIKVVAEKQAIVESKEREVKIIKESADRKEKLSEMLKPLGKEKATVMSELLESVQTEKLQSAFEKYLPAVLNNAPVKQAPKAMLSESRSEVTGDKSANKVAVNNDVTNVIDIKRLAGLK